MGNFYKRYEEKCIEKGLDPCAQSTAERMEVTRATISQWNKRGSIPKGETVKLMADMLGVSADWLLDRTDDPTDYTRGDLIAQESGPALDALGGDVAKAVAFHRAVDADAARENAPTPYVLRIYERLDPMDQARVVAYIEGILTQDRYKNVKEETL